ncbi:MAG: hypothetical protein IJY70_01010 [Clostridia bacterium]|nr:hypothetical protein [Clostridia bacterium]
MRKVVYSVTKIGRYGNIKTSGFGLLNETDLITFYTGKDGKRHSKVYDDCIRYCHRIGTSNEFKGNYYEIRELEFETHNSIGQSTGYDTREIEISYFIWYKFID